MILNCGAADYFGKVYFENEQQFSISICDELFYTACIDIVYEDIIVY